MRGSRRARRRSERQRGKRAPARRSFSGTTRILLLTGGVLAIVAGAVLLTQGGSRNEARLARVAGIMLVLGLVALVAGLVGTL